MADWKLDWSRRPIVLIYLDVRPGEDEAPNMESFMSAGRALLDSPVKLAVVLDLTGARPDAARRQKLIEWMSVNGDALRSVVSRAALVAPSAFLRGAFTAVSWFLPRKVPHEIFATRAEALAWIARS